MSEVSISKSEWKVMSVLWKGSPLSAQEVIKALSEDATWKPQTVKTLLGRLVKKGALSYDTVGNKYLYKPEISEDRAVSGETTSFISRICKNSLMPLLAHSLEVDRKLDKDEVQALRDLLAKQENK